jgi:hypothetical protein
MADVATATILTGTVQKQAAVAVIAAAIMTLTAHIKPPMSNKIPALEFPLYIQPNP